MASRLTGVLVKSLTIVTEKKIKMTLHTGLDDGIYRQDI